MAVGNLAPLIPALFTGPNGERLTADQIKRRQEIAESLMAQATDTSPNAGGWASILAKGVQGFAAGRERRSADNASSTNAAESQKRLSSMLGIFTGGAPASTTPSIGGLPPAVSTGAGAELAATSPSGASGPSAYRDAIASIESAGSGDYAAIGPTNPKLGRALGRYQIMEANIAPWSREVLGREVTADEFIANPQLQDAIFDGKFNSYVSQYGPEGAAQAWFAGPGGVGKTSRKDVLGTTVGDYGQKFVNAIGAQEVAGIPAPALTEPYREVTSLPVAGYQDPMVAAPNTSPVASALVAQSRGAQASAPALPPINPAVIETLTSPYASADEKAVAQMLFSDFQQEKDRAEKQALAQQQRAAEIARRQAIAQQTGIDPSYAADDDIWKGAAGNLFAAPSTSTVNGAVIDNRTRDVIYQAPAETYRQVYGDEAAAIGLDPSKAYNIGPDGKISPIGEGGVTVNNNMGNDKFGEEFAKLDANALGAVSASGLAAQRNIGRINQLDELLKSSPTGFEGALAQRAGEWGIKTEGLDTIQAAQAAINSLVPEQRQPGSGPMSDADLALFKQSLPRIINQPGGNQLIIGTMRSIAQYDAEGAQIVQQLRNNEIDRAQAFQMLQSRPNPLESFKVPAQQENPLPPQTNGRKTSTGATWEVLD